MSDSRQNANESVRLNASKMFDYAFYGLIQALTNNGYYDLTELEADQDQDEDDRCDSSYKIEILTSDSKEMYGAQFTLVRYNRHEQEREHHEIVLLRPASDTDEIVLNGDAIGTVPLAKALAYVKELQAQKSKAKSVKYIIPLAECNDRFHWTKLVINGNDCEHFDPKSSPNDYLYPISLFYKPYSIEPLKAILRAAKFDKNNKLETSFLGLQGVFNNTHCGYYLKESLEDVINTVNTVNTVSSLASIFTKLKRESLNASNKTIVSSRERPAIPSSTPAELEKEFQNCRKTRDYRKYIASNERIASFRGTQAIPFKNSPPAGIYCLGQRKSIISKLSTSSDDESPSPRAVDVVSTSSSSLDEESVALTNSRSSSSLEEKGDSPLSLSDKMPESESKRQVTPQSKIKLSPEENKMAMYQTRMKKWQRKRSNSSPEILNSNVAIHALTHSVKHEKNTHKAASAPKLSALITDDDEFAVPDSIHGFRNKYWPAITGAIVGMAVCIAVAAFLLHPLGVGLAATTIGVEVGIDIGYFLGAMFCGALFGASLGAVVGQCRAHFNSPGYDNDVTFPASDSPSSTSVIGAVVGLSPKESKEVSPKNSVAVKIEASSPVKEAVKPVDDTYSIFRQTTGAERERFMGPRC